MARTVVVAGATGLVGGHVARRLCAHAAWSRVVVVGRRPIGWSHPKLVERAAELTTFPSALADLPVTDAVCALGTTHKKAGSKEAFRAVDLDGVIAFARAAREAGAERFVLVSAIGASASSPSHYSKVKGLAEDAVASLGFAELTVLRPSVLFGERSEARPLEAVGIRVGRWTGGLMVGPLAPYRGIEADDVAAAAVGALLRPGPARRVWTYAELMAGREVA